MGEGLVGFAFRAGLLRRSGICCRSPRQPERTSWCRLEYTRARRDVTCESAVSS